MSHSCQAITKAWNHGNTLPASAFFRILLKGYGFLPDLAYSMTLDESLRELVESYVLDVLTLPAEQVRTEFETLLLSWAGVNNVPANGRGNYIDGKVVAFLEKYFGSDFVGNADGTIGSRYAEVIQTSFDTVVDVLLTRFLSQSMVSALNLDADPESLLASPFLPLTLLAYDMDGERFTNDPDDVVGWIMELAPSNVSQKLDYYAKAITGLLGLKYEYFKNDTATFKTYILSKVSDAEPQQHGLLTFVDAFLDVGKLIGGTSETDTLTGTSSKDILLASLGNDTLSGKGGNDTYVYSRGDGNDTIAENSADQGYADKLILTDINPGDVTLSRNGSSLVIAIRESAPGAGNAGSVTVLEGIDDWSQRGIEAITFANGTTWDRNQIKALAWVRGTVGNDTLSGSSGNDTLLGDAGNDTITTGAGNDIIVFKPNFGIDTITDFEAGAGSVDVIEFDNSLFADFEDVLAAAAQVGNDTVMMQEARSR